MALRLAVSLLLVGILNAPLNAAQRLNLIDALNVLRGQGFEIVWSNDLVSNALSIDVARVDFDSVAAALPALGLRFEHSGDVWLVTRAEAQSGPVPQGRDAKTDVGATPLETVIVTGSRHHVPAGVDAAHDTISAEDMRVTPALAGDAMRISTRLPGMSSVGISAKPLVRGGVGDETLIVMDGVELLDPFHLADFQNIFSSIDDRTVESVDVYTGGFPARYGNRMSGVMDIAIEPATPARTELGISLFSVFANTRGSSADGATSWLASARRGNLELLVDWLDRSLGSPKYDDVFARVGRRVSDHTTVYLGVHTSRDNISLSDNEEHATSDIDTTYLWARLDSQLSEAWSNSSVFSYVTSDRDRTESNGEPDVAVGFLDYSQEVRKYTLRSDFHYQAGDLVMELGGQADYSRSTYNSQASIERGPVAPVLGNSPTAAWDIDVAPSGWSGGAYWSADIALGDSFSVQPGLRWDFQDYFDSGLDAYLSPRLGLRYAPSERLTARLAVGRYYQPEGIHEMKAVDGVDHFYSPQHADHVVLGVEWTPSDRVGVRGEAYYKDYEKTRPRFENVFNTFVLLPQLEPDRVQISPNRARVEGVDLQGRLDLSEAVSALVRGSWMNADDRIDGEWVPRKWSQHYTLQGMVVWQRDSWSASAALTWHSGWRTTALPPVVPVGAVLPLESVLNHDVLPNYVSLDLSLRKSWQLGRTTIMLLADVTNAFDHDNAAGIDYVSNETASSVVLKPDREQLLPWVPSIGVTVAF
jgi:outer membrane receptor for ferrienterochelin and colicin